MAEDAEVRQHLHQVVMLRPFPYFPSHKERFSKQFQPLNVFESSEPAHLFLSTHAQSARVLLCAGFTPVTSDMLRCLPSLQCIITTSAGVEHIDLGECRRRGIAVANAGNAFSVDVADYAVGLLLDVLRRISAADSYVRRGLWPVQGDFRLGHKCIVGTSAGVDHIDLAECRRRGISVTNAGTAFSEDVADLAVGFFLDLLRRVSSTDRYVRRGLWPLNGDYPLGFKLGGKRVGIVGLGSIGSEIAKRLEAFGCSISYNSRRKKPSVSFPYYSNVYDLAADSDVLILSCALTEETFHMVNKDVLSALGKEGIIINVGRGALIDEKELVRCLVQGEIGGAGLDVFEKEPDVPKELFALDNVILSPHRAVLTPESFDALQELVIGNLEAFFSNKPLLSPVKDE
ncbi:PREDICTED: glyoxylate/hydroxypyruvate reductase HPR3 isoform X1 [Nelumbo nucifera]|uniref:Glyoxylate/hydroxypyruvate reductase HPR3 isoform X1 n=1 Tax=Nelumbo nucifera TaxID=4432 RepID=A0A1U8Q8P7_NELNU|nr:PREDICTED: glyoxylate/hydroxypyruvate reductase HPR3 isoform X1 [Nelumbo nucifera]